MFLEVTSQAPTRTLDKKYKLIQNAYGVELFHTPSFARGISKSRGVRAKGLRYEAHVISHLEKILDPERWTGFDKVWLRYTDRKGAIHYAQPDWFGIDCHRGLVCVVEVKLSRVPEAWWQLNQLYVPLLSRVFKGWDFACVEIAANVRHLKDIPVRVIRDLNDCRVGETAFMKVDYHAR